MIGWENYEEYMMMHADGELQPAEKQELMDFVAAHPDLKAELRAFSLTHLSPDETIVYAGKDLLLKPEPSRRIIAFPQWRRYAIAAGVALLVSLSFYKYREVNKSVDGITVTHTMPVMPKAVQPVIDTNTAFVPKEVQSPKTGVAIVTSPRKIAPVTNRRQHKPIMPLIKEEKEEQAVAAIKDTTTKAVQPIAPVEQPQVAVKKEQPFIHVDTTATVAALPVPEAQDDRMPKKRSLIDRLPIDESNKNQLRKLFRVAKGTYNGVNKVKQELDAGEITVSVEDNKLRVSF